MNDFRVWNISGVGTLLFWTNYFRKITHFCSIKVSVLDKEKNGKHWNNQSYSTKMCSVICYIALLYTKIVLNVYGKKQELK